MKPKEHIKYSLLPVIVLSYINWVYGLLFFTGAVLIDSDHVLEYYGKTRDFHVGRMLEFYDHLMLEFYNRYYLGISIFHTIEFLFFATWLAFKTENAIYFLTGLIFHHILDFIYLQRINCLFKRSYSLIYYFYVSNLKENNDFKKMCKKEKEIYENILNKQ